MQTTNKMVASLFIDGFHSVAGQLNNVWSADGALKIDNEIDEPKLHSMRLCLMVKFLAWILENLKHEQIFHWCYAIDGILVDGLFFFPDAKELPVVVNVCFFLNE